MIIETVRGPARPNSLVKTAGGELKCGILPMLLIRPIDRMACCVLLLSSPPYMRFRDSYFQILMVLLFGSTAMVQAGPEAVVTFNEIQYHPQDSQLSGEWIELRNQQSVDVDMSGWRLDGGVDYVFPAGTKIAGSGFLVIAADPVAFTAATGVPAIGPFLNLLADGGEKVTLKNHNGRMMDEISYNDRFPWPQPPDGSGATLAKINELDSSQDPFHWRASVAYGGSPGEYNFVAPVGVLPPPPSQAGNRRYFPLDGDAKDLSGNGMHGTLKGGVGFAAEFPPIIGAGQSLNCDGVDDYVEVLDTNGGSSAYTISLWVKPDLIRAQCIITRASSSSPSVAQSHQIRMKSTGEFQHYTTSSSYNVTSTTKAVVGQWYHVCAVAGNGGKVRIFVNGVEEGTAPTVTGLTNVGDRWFIGSKALGVTNYFKGRIDDVAIWHTAFDAATVAKLTTRVVLPTDPAPVNRALNKAVINASGHWPNQDFSQDPTAGNDFRPLHVTDGSISDVYSNTYWLGRDGVPNQWFIVDLGAPVAMKSILLRNTHNASNNDRGTLNFTLSASNAVDGSNLLVAPTQILSGSLTNVAGQSPILAAPFSTQNGLTATTARYVKFESLTAVNNHAGLNEIEIYDAFTGVNTPTQNTHPGEVPLIINEITADGSDPFWVELYNPGASMGIGGYMLVSESGIEFPIPAQTLSSGGYVTFSSTQMGFAPVENEFLYLYGPGKFTVIDAVKVKATHQAKRSSNVRSDFLETINLAEQTPGAVNNVALTTGIVINEIMYHHRPQYRDGATPYLANEEAWIELYNRSGASIDIGGWKLDDAVSYTFPLGTVIAPGGFAVIANDAATFNAAHPGVTAVGAFSGGLSNRGERIVLRDMLGNIVNEVFYRDNRPWPVEADGGGSSLELRDPDADNSVPEAWAASDETSRSGWQNYSFTATAQTPTFTPNIFNFHELRLGLLDAGEILIDDVSVIEDPAGLHRELMQNGGFTSGTTAWRLLGTHGLSNVVSDGGGNVLKLVATGASNYHPNLLETSLKAAGSLVPVVEGRQYQISFRAKWLRGSPQLHAELYYNKVAKTIILAQPALSGTPGAPNSTLAPNIGPTFRGVMHSPVIPPATTAMVVSAQLSDPQGVGTATLKYSVGGAAVQSVTMALGTDGKWAGTIPGQAASAIVQFWLEATDAAGQLSMWPAAGAASRALIQVADNRASAGRQNLRITMTAADSTAMYTQSDMMNNRRRGCTIVHNETEVFYDGQVRLHGSMFSRSNSANASMNVYFPSDHRFRGVHDKIYPRVSGRNEIVIKHLINSSGGLPENYDDSVWLVGPTATVGNQAARLEMTQFDRIYFNDDQPDGAQGTSFKMEGIREYQSTVSGSPEGIKSPWPNIGWVFGFDIAKGGGSSSEVYRHNFKLTSNRDEDNYSKIVATCEAFSQPVGPAMDAAVDAAIDADQWMRCLALEGLCGIGDGYGFPSGNPHNINFYAPPGGGKMLLVPWDWNFPFYNATDSSLFPTTHNISVVAARPIFARLYWGHIRHLCQTSFTGAAISPWCTHYGALMGDNYGGYPAYVEARRNYALSVLPAVVPFNITTNGGAPFTTPDDTVILNGDGWIDVKTIRQSGSTETLAVTWLDGDSWQVTVSVEPGTHDLTLNAFDHDGLPVGTDTISITSTSVVVPAGSANVVISELMYHPAAGGSEFVEIMNIGAQKINLTNCSFTLGINYDFPNGATLLPGARFVITAGQFLNGKVLSNGGEQVRLIDALGAEIKDFTYSDNDPWPGTPDGLGPSLVLIAPQSNPDHKLAASWRASVAAGGNPGTGDGISLLINPLGDDDQDGWTNLVEHALGQNPTLVPSRSGGLLKMVVPRQFAADNALVRSEFSTDLTHWVPGVLQSVTATTATYLAPATMLNAPRQYSRIKVDFVP